MALHVIPSFLFPPPEITSIYLCHSLATPCQRRNSPIRPIRQEPLFAAVLVQYLILPRVFAGSSPVSVPMANGAPHLPAFHWSDSLNK